MDPWVNGGWSIFFPEHSNFIHSVFVTPRLMDCQPDLAGLWVSGKTDRWINHLKRRDTNYLVTPLSLSLVLTLGCKGEGAKTSIGRHWGKCLAGGCHRGQGGWGEVRQEGRHKLGLVERCPGAPQHLTLLVAKAFLKVVDGSLHLCELRRAWCQ